MIYRKQLYVLIFGMVMSSSLLVTDQAQAEIFKCVNQQGAVYYNDKPCPSKDIETQIRNAKDPKGVASQPQYFSNVEVVDEKLSSKELTDLRNQQRFDFVREQSGASEDDEGIVPPSEDSEFLNYEG